MSVTEGLIQEFETEAATTRRVLERVPSDRLAWKPHPKSMSMGTLAMHIASGPGFITEWALKDSVEMPGGEGSSEAKSTAEILTAHDDGAKKTAAGLRSIGDAGLQRNWKMTNKDGVTLMAMPKAALVRSIVLNHIYHHRGQLSVYLRLLDIPVPSIYGPSADENPMAAAH